MQINAEAIRALQVLNGLGRTVLAGGYLRDLLLGRQPKDIDFFIQGRVDRAALHQAFPQFKPEPFSEWLAYKGREVAGVYDLGQQAGGLPMQLIELAEGYDPVERVTAHDFGICQIWTEDGVSIKTTPEFDLDAVNQTFTLTTCENPDEFDRSLKRYDRLRQKYPEFNLVIPEKFHQWIPTL
jgi:hypothetical protein